MKRGFGLLGGRSAPSDCADGSGIRPAETKPRRQPAEAVFEWLSQVENGGIGLLIAEMRTPAGCVPGGPIYNRKAQGSAAVVSVFVSENTTGTAFQRIFRT